MVAVNGLAGSTTLIGGKVTAEISNANPTLVTPAGYAFSIWGLIYLLLGVFVIYQALPRTRTDRFQEDVGWLFVLSSALNIAWLFAWQYEALIFSVVIMFLLLATLIAIYLRLGIGRARAGWPVRLAVHLPFSVYLGWITIASIANVATALVSIGWNGFGVAPEAWAVLMILVALLIAVLMAVTRRDVAYEAVVVWALVAIAVNQISDPLIVGVALASAVGAVVALAASFYFLGRTRRTVTG